MVKRWINFNISVVKGAIASECFIGYLYDRTQQSFVNSLIEIVSFVKVHGLQINEYLSWRDNTLIQKHLRSALGTLLRAKPYLAENRY